MGRLTRFHGRPARLIARFALALAAGVFVYVMMLVLYDRAP